jgi:nucleoside-diphosphate-sugar epimerase
MGRRRRSGASLGRGGPLLTTAFVTGGTGLVGRALITRLVTDGHRVTALIRDAAGAEAVEKLGAVPIFGDLIEEGTWRYDAQEADSIWHTAMPRVGPPLRTLGARRRATLSRRMAENLATCCSDGHPITIASTALVFGDRMGEATGEDAPIEPIAMGHAAHAAERALARPNLRVVRLGWVYGTLGLGDALTRGLASRRFRIVGEGANRWPLISADDAAGALVVAAAASAGLYTAAEVDAPTQNDVVREICTQAGYAYPDRLPVRMASLSLGGQLAAALATSLDLPSARLRAQGWAPADDWRRDLLSRCRGESAAG